jgi:hypothetical protein
MTAKFTVLGNTTLATASASVTFSSIPGGYKDLVLVVTGTKTVSGVAGLRVQANSDTGNNYRVVNMEGDGTSASSATSSPNDYIEGSNSRTFSTVSVASASVVIFDFSATNKHKSVLSRSSRADGTEGYAYASCSRWASTSAITSLLAYSSSGNFAAGSTFRLLGVN